MKPPAAHSQEGKHLVLIFMRYSFHHKHALTPSAFGFSTSLAGSFFSAFSGACNCKTDLVKCSEIRICLFITTVLVQIARALIKLQMLTFQSDSLVSMKKMGRYSRFQHCTSVGHCTLLLCHHWAYVLNELLTCLLRSIHQL